jgi:hypothetical protein
MAYATNSNDVYLNLENFAVANDGSHFYTRQTSYDPDNNFTNVIKYSNKQDMVDFITEQNWRFFTYLQQLYNVYEKVFVNQIIPLCTAHNSAVTAFTSAKSSTAWETAATIDTTNVSDATAYPAKGDARKELQTAYLQKLKDAVKGTIGTWNYPYSDISWCYAPRGHYGWWNDNASNENCLANSALKYDSLYNGCIVGARFRMKLPEYQVPSSWNDGVFTAQAVSMTNYENLWKAYYNTIINLANNVRSGATVTSTYAIQQCRSMVLPKKYYDIIDGTSSPSSSVTSAIVLNNITYTDSWGRFTPESGAMPGFYKLVKNIGADLVDWKYNRVPNMFSDYITKANQALETLKKKDSTGEFRKWVEQSGFTIWQKPYGATLVYDDTIQCAGGIHDDVVKWETQGYKYYLAYNPHPTNITFWNPYNRDIYCSKSDIKSGRVKVNAGDY